MPHRNASDARPAGIAVVATGCLVRTVPAAPLPSARALDAARGRVTISTQVTGPFAGAGSLGILDTREGRVIRTVKMGGRLIAVSRDETLGRSFAV